jgi:hypothetical protein
VQTLLLNINSGSENYNRLLEVVKLRASMDCSKVGSWDPKTACKLEIEPKWGSKQWTDRESVVMKTRKQSCWRKERAKWQRHEGKRPA